MTEDYRLLAAVIAAHPNRQLVGRTRLQKTVKLLQRLGLPTHFGYTIHFYGPYSEDVQSSMTLLANLGLAREEAVQSQNGDTYFVEHAGLDADPKLVCNWFSYIQKMSETDVTVLELAATYDAFREQGSNHEAAIDRLKRKKGSKCDGGNVEKALALLTEFKLPSN
jgi:uncharacterized protein YwgA